ncbi:MAG: class C beta-lactamase-related serine hydrolase [Gammaproteobacteria bacterium]|nr:MAG: class C beta-lactamase-related serine hydrolase [Gammaproteobacteria bacterium]
MKLLLRITSLFTLILFTPFLHADPTLPKTLDQLKDAIEKIRKDSNTPAIGIALVNRDGPYWIEALGEANTETHVKANENTMFPIASISKMFVSLAVLKLVEEGKLRLDDELKDLVPKINFENQWEKTNPVRLVNLLENTTGWDDVHLAEINFKKSDSSSLKSALDFHPDSRTSRWIPGTRYAYNSIAPAVAAYIVESMTGKKYENYIKENFFTPLDMKSTTFYKTSDYDTHGAVLYNANGTPEKYNFAQYRPSGSINSSTKEMANLLQFFIQRGEFSGHKILDKTSIDRMEKPTSTLGAAAGITSGYGLNNFTKGFEDFGYDFHGHDGGGTGSFSELMYSPALGQGYVILTNTNNGAAWQISQLLMSYLLKNGQKKTSVPLPLGNKLSSLPGVYVQLNYQVEIMRFASNIENAIKISVENNRVHRSPVFGGWLSNDYAIGENLLIDSWTGLPSIAIVNDPIAGETLQVNGELYKRIPALLFFSGIVLFLLLILSTIINIIFSITWVPRLLLGKIAKSASIKIRIWPLLASLTVAAIFLLIAFGGKNITVLGSVNWVSISLFLSSVLYPVFTVMSLMRVYKYRHEAIGRLTYWGTAAFSVLHVLLVVYLTYFGLTGFRGWAE